MAFDINGRDPQSFQVTELATDVHLLRDGVPVFTGRVGSTAHSLEADGHKRSVQVADTRALLARRLTLVSRAYAATNVDAAAAFRDMVLDAQAPAGGDLGVTVPAFPALGVTVSRSSEAGQPILKELQETAGVSSGASVAAPLFDWDITPGWVGRQFQLWRQRGAARGVFLDYTFSDVNPRSSNIAALTRTFDPGSYANSVYVTGGVKKVKVQQEVQSESQPDPVNVGTVPATAVTSTGSVTRGTKSVTTTQDREKERLTQLAVQASASAREASDRAATYDSQRARFEQARIAAGSNSALAASYAKQRDEAQAKRNTAFEQATKFQNQATAYYAQAAQITGTTPVVTVPDTRTDTTTQVTDSTTVKYEEVEIEIPTTPVNRLDGSLAWSVGVWASAVGYTDIVEQSELESKAVATLAELQQVTPSYSLSLFPGFWQGPNHIWLGDTVTVHIDSGSLYETATLRVTEISIDLSDDGQESVNLTVGSPAPQYLNTLMEATRRISTLERRR